MSLLRFVIALAVLSVAALASDELTVYDLLAPATHSFAIAYHISTAVEGSPYLFNPIRRGSAVSNERVVDAATGKPLKFALVSASAAQQHGLKGRTTADNYLQVTLARPVAKGAESRVRIYKTYRDEASYFLAGSDIVFERPLGIKRNVVVLPAGYELIACGAPGIVSTDSDGRIRISFFNDRDDELMVKIRGRKLP